MSELPFVSSRPGLPEHVRIFEVGPRDGLQNEQTVVDSAVKVELVERLVRAGLRTIEATSFVRPDKVPQLADAEQVMTNLDVDQDAVHLTVLVPNLRGLERAVALGSRHIAIFGSATDTFARRNLDRGVEEQFDMFAPTVTRARELGLKVRAYVSMCFGDPWEGQVSVARVVEVGKRLFDLGAEELSIGDTIGVATPGHVHELVEAFVDAGLPVGDLALHLHDTYGQGLANAYAGLEAGITTFDASAGGLGGCPFAKGATGNLATEDLVWMLDGLGIGTGVDLDELVATSLWMEGHLGKPSVSRVVRARAAA